jgi:hypothetical protein
MRILLLLLGLRRIRDIVSLFEILLSEKIASIVQIYVSSYHVIWETSGGKGSIQTNRIHKIESLDPVGEMVTIHRVGGELNRADNQVHVYLLHATICWYLQQLPFIHPLYSSYARNI